MSEPAPAPIESPFVEAAVERLVWYFDVFSWPLMDDELDALAGHGTLAAIGRLKDRGRIGGAPGWSHAPRRDDLVAGRRLASRRAEHLWPVARRSAATLAALPWIRGVLITGGMSKRCVREDADVDFLLLVEPGRVWLTKTALQVARRGLPRWARRAFCTNYILATDCLEIPEENAFTAVELATAIPMFGPDSCVALLEANAWSRRYVPGLDWSLERAANASPLARPPAPPSNRAWVDRVDRLSMELWDAYWSRKYDWLPSDALAKRFKRRRGVATNHLGDHQQWLLDSWTDRLERAGVSVP